MRCPDCSKFVSMENGDPEVNELDIETNDGSYTIMLNVDLVRNCADCGTELKRASGVAEEETIEFDDGEGRCLSVESEGKVHDLAIEEDGSDVDESGGGRYAKNMIACTTSYTITCNRGGCAFQKTGQITASTNAGSFEESV